MDYEILRDVGAFLALGAVSTGIGSYVVNKTYESLDSSLSLGKHMGNGLLKLAEVTGSISREDYLRIRSE